MGVLDALKRKGPMVRMPKVEVSSLKPSMGQAAPVLGRVAGLQKEPMVSPAKDSGPKSALLRKMLGLR